MRRRPLKQLSDQALAEAFVEAANELGEAVNYWLPTAKKARRLLAIGDSLRARGRDSRLLLTPLLDDQNRFVQYYAAKELEGLLQERCRQIIEWNAKQRDAIAGDAGMHLYAIESGIYKPD
jgi:Domain of unknown function (DUF2019)